MMKDEFRRDTTLEEITLVYPATVLAASREQMMQVLRARHVLDESVLDGADPFFFGAEISNNRRDLYDTRMDVATTLKNYAEDATEGVSLCDSHYHDSVMKVLGRSLSGELIDAEGANPRVLAAFYMMPEEGEINRIINRVRAGTIKDVSVGFKPGDNFEYRCRICNRDMLTDWDCYHVPGRTYKLRDDEGNEIERRAVAWVIDARLSEVSPAYDGATPGCMILVAQREVETGRMTPALRNYFNTRFRMNLPALPVVSGYRKGEDEAMSDDKNRATGADDKKLVIGGDAFGSIRSLVTGLNIESLSAKYGEDVKERAATAIIDDLVTEIRALQPLAADGKTFRDAEIQGALDEGIRAGVINKDEAGAVDAQRATLSALPIKTVQNMRAMWKTTADKNLGGGGRRSSDDAERTDEQGGDRGEDKTAPRTERMLPDAALANV